jgi:hypothetical protein
VTLEAKLAPFYIAPLSSCLRPAFTPPFIALREGRTPLLLGMATLFSGVDLPLSSAAWLADLSNSCSRSPSTGSRTCCLAEPTLQLAAACLDAPQRVSSSSQPRSNSSNLVGAILDVDKNLFLLSSTLIHDLSISIYLNVCAEPSCRSIYSSISHECLDMCYSVSCSRLRVGCRLAYVVFFVCWLCVLCLSEDRAVEPVERTSACSMRPRVTLPWS